MLKSFRSTGNGVTALTALRSSIFPLKKWGSVSTEMAAAPARVYSFAYCAGSMSTRISPFEGEAFLISAIIPACPGQLLSMAWRNELCRIFLFSDLFSDAFFLLSAAIFSAFFLISFKGMAALASATSIFFRESTFLRKPVTDTEIAMFMHSPV